MALELKPTSGWWYARFVVNKRIHRYKLNRVEGRRPVSLTKSGDGPFEKSRREGFQDRGNG